MRRGFIPASGHMRVISRPSLADPSRWARPGSKLWRVANRLLAVPGRWVTGLELHDAYGERGWSHDSAVAQLRAKGMVIESRPIPGQDQFEYRAVLAPELQPHLARTGLEVERRRTELRGGLATSQTVAGNGALSPPRGSGNAAYPKRAPAPQQPRLI